MAGNLLAPFLGHSTPCPVLSLQALVRNGTSNYLRSSELHTQYRDRRRSCCLAAPESGSNHQHTDNAPHALLSCVYVEEVHVSVARCCEFCQGRLLDR